MSKGIVFVSSDWVCKMLASELGMLDCEVIRGPIAAGPELTAYDPVTAERLLGRADVILASPSLRVDRATLLAAPRLRAVIAPAIGVENIDVDAATELGIIIGHGATPEKFLGMAEATVLLIAALALQLPYKQRLMADNAPRPRELVAHSVRGRTVGLVGMGPHRARRGRAPAGLGNRHPLLRSLCATGSGAGRHSKRRARQVAPAF